MNAIEINSLTKTFKKSTAVDNISLKVEEGRKGRDQSWLDEHPLGSYQVNLMLSAPCQCLVEASPVSVSLSRAD